MARYLIDTNIFAYSLSSPEKISKEIREIIENGENEIFLSAVSLWEMDIKHGIGKLKLPPYPYEYLLQKIKDYNFTILPVMGEHALTITDFDRHHEDPFDHMLIAQALSEDMTILTADSKLKKYAAKVILN